MLEYKVSTDIVVPVVLTVTSTGLPHTGVAFGSVTVTVIKANGATATFTPTAGQWAEFSADAFAGSGYYNLTVPLAHTGVAGILQYSVKVTADDSYFGVFALVANLESDTYSRLGAPAGASVSGDLAAVKAQTQAIDTKTTNLPPNPADASDVAAVQSGVTELLGMVHKNAVLQNQTYSAGGRLTSATLKVYDTAAHASLNDGVTGLLKTYVVFATYDLSDHQTLYRLTTVP